MSEVSSWVVKIYLYRCCVIPSGMLYWTAVIPSSYYIGLCCCIRNACTKSCIAIIKHITSPIHFFGSTSSYKRITAVTIVNDDVIKWKHFQRYWPSMFSGICPWTNSWANNGDAGDLRRHRAHYDVIVMACEAAEFIMQLYAKTSGMELLTFCITFHAFWLTHWGLKFVPKGQVNNIPTLVQIMTWRRPDDKSVSEPMMVSLQAHIWVTRPQWFEVSDLPYTTVRLALNMYFVCMQHL